MAFRTFARLVSAAAVMLAASGAAFAAGKIAIITPYLAQPGTQYYVESFQAAAKENGWSVNVIDTKGDVAAVISRIEDVANQKVDAIVINVDPSQVTAGLETAKKAGVPVFGMDSGASPLLVTNVTSNGYEMAADTAAYVANRIGGKGGNFEASMSQDFKGIGRAVADAVKRQLAGEKIKQTVIYVPTKLITVENVKQ